MTVSIPKWLKGVLGLMVVVFILIPFIIAILPNGTPEPEVTTTSGGAPWFMFWLVVFTTIILIMKPKPGTKAEERKSRWLTAIVAALLGASVSMWSAQLLEANDWQFGPQKKLDVTPHFAENVELGDPTGTGRAPRPSLKSIRGYTCPNMSRLEKIPTGWTVDTTEEWYGRVVIDLFDKKGRKTTVTAHGLHVAVQFQLCVKFERDNGEDISLKWTEAP